MTFALTRRRLLAMRPVQMAKALGAPCLLEDLAGASLRSVTMAFAHPGARAPAFPLHVTMAIAAPFGMTEAVPRIFATARRASRDRLSLPACDIARADCSPPSLQVLQLIPVQLILLLPLAEVKQWPEHVQLLHVPVLVHKQPGPITPLHREDAVELVRDGVVDVLHSRSPWAHQIRPRAEDLPGSRELVISLQSQEFVISACGAGQSAAWCCADDPKVRDRVSLTR